MHIPSSCLIHQDLYSHRAGRGLPPENTLEACALSLQYPVDFIDFDIVMTRDEQLVALHDLILNPDITRTPNGEFITDEIAVYDLTFSELSQYNVGLINPASLYASYFPMQRSYPVAHVPRLKEAIEYVQRKKPLVGFQLEIKTNPTQAHLSPSPEKLAYALAALLEEMGIVHQTEVQSFDYRCLIEIKKINPAIQTAFLSHPTHLAGYDLEEFGGSYSQLIYALGGQCWVPSKWSSHKKRY